MMHHDASFADLDARHGFRHFLGFGLEIGSRNVQATVGHANEGTQDEQEPKETGHRAAFLRSVFCSPRPILYGSKGQSPSTDRSVT
jgi:hypothetical protein